MLQPESLHLTITHTVTPSRTDFLLAPYAPDPRLPRRHHLPDVFEALT